MSIEFVARDGGVDAVPVCADLENLNTVYRPSILYTVFERVICGAALIAFIPLILVLMVLIRLDSRGSPIFVQDRIARGAKRPFKFVKLRSMYTDSAQRFPDLCAYEYDDDEVADVKLSLSKDPRVTRMGAFLRKTSLDELPNLWNVVTGQMTLVGPRPEMWCMLKYYDARTLRKFAVTPGITGYAQIYGRGDLTFEETVDLDLAYVDEASFSTDMRVLKETVLAVACQRGAH